ncbi:hypothetical protein GCM10007415_34000 [Parapedobacter pyrenivorans]|uniref:Chloramphenicol acetyltransferase n=2 Tax=Parapedobacter pyrenivorans TaxID=1305674 RepID=A0A917HX38_9SPHI|nr:hypothetical protein GCM10007415_34000 [Parapedobacter pyrenivorans]
MIIGKICMIASGVKFIINGANREKFSTEKIAEHLVLKWWDWDIKKITENLEFLTSKTSRF